MSAPAIAPDEIPIDEAEAISFGGPGAGRASYERRLRELATQAGIDPDIAVRQIDQESKWDPRAVGPMTKYGRARGLTQFIETTGAKYGLKTEEDFFNVDKSLHAYVSYMGDLKKQWGGNINAMLANYNGGTAAGRAALEERWDDLPDETRDYLKRIVPEKPAAEPAAPAADAISAAPEQEQPDRFGTQFAKQMGGAEQSYRAPVSKQGRHRNEGGPGYVPVGEISIEDAEKTPERSQLAIGAEQSWLAAQNTIANLASTIGHGMDLENTWKGASRAIGDAPFGSAEWSKRLETYRKSLLGPPTEKQTLDLGDPEEAKRLEASLAQSLDGTDVGAALSNLLMAYLGPVNPEAFRETYGPGTPGAESPVAFGARAWQQLGRSLRAHVAAEQKKIPPTPPGLPAHLARGAGAAPLGLAEFMASLAVGGPIGTVVLAGLQQMDQGAAEAMKAAMLNLFFASAGPAISGLSRPQRMALMGLGGGGIAAAEGAGVEDITTATLIGSGIGFPGGRPSAERVRSEYVRPPPRARARGEKVSEPEVMPPEGETTAVARREGKQPETIDVTPIRDELGAGRTPKQLGPGEAPKPPPAETPKPPGPPEKAGEGEGAVLQLDRPVKYPSAKESPFGSVGNSTMVLIPGSGTTAMQRFPARYRLMEADEVITSHRADSLARRSDYPANVQERSYHVKRSPDQVKIETELAQFVPEFIYTDNPTGENGPTITGRGIAIGGNSRAIVQLQVYNGQSKVMKPEELKQHVVSVAERFGLSPQLASEMKMPTVVRELDDLPVTYRELGTLSRDLQEGFTLEVDAASRGISNGRAMTHGTLEAIGEILDGAGNDLTTIRKAFRGNRDIVAALERDGIIHITNRPAYVDSDTGTLTAAGLALVEDAFIGRVVGNPDTLMNMKPAMRNRMLRISPSVLRVERLAPELEFPLLLEEALRHEHKRQSAPGKRLTIEQYLAPRKQSDLEVQLPPSGPAAQLMRALGIKNNEQVRILFAQFARYVAALKKQSDLFRQGPSSVQEAFEAAFGRPEGPQLPRFSVELEEGEIPLGPAESWPNPPPELVWPDGAQVVAEMRQSANEFNVKLHGPQAALITVDPGPKWTGHIEPSPLQTYPTAKRPVQPSEVVFGLLEAFGYPLKTGKIRGIYAGGGRFTRPPANMAGYFQAFYRVMRARQHHDLHTDVHEFGHLLEDLNGNLVRALWSPQEAARGQQLINASQGWPQNHDSIYLDMIAVSYDRAKIQEGWAEAVRLWFTDKEYTRQNAPNFYKWFNETFLPSLSKRERNAMLKAQEGAHKYIAQGPLNQIEAMIGPRHNAALTDVGVTRLDWIRVKHLNRAYGGLRAERRVTGEDHVIGGIYEAMIRLAREPSIRRIVLERGQLVRDRARGIDAVRIEGPSMTSVLAPMVLRSADDLRLFRLYAIGRATAETAAQGRESLITPLQRFAAKHVETPEFRAAFDELIEAHKYSKEFGISTGLYSAESAARWRREEYAFALWREPVPGHLKRLQADPSRAMSSYNPIRRYSGGSEALQEPLHTMIEGPVRLYMAGLDNLMRQRVADELINTERGGLVGKRIPSEHKKVSIHRQWFASAVARELKEAGDPWLAKYVNRVLQTGGEAFVELWMPFQRPVGDDVMVVLREGRPEYYEITDPILAATLRHIRGGYQIQNGVMTALDNFRRFQQSVVTLWPGFMMKNIPRDQQTAWVSAEIPYNPFTDFITGLRHSIEESEFYWDMLANGGGNSTLRTSTTVIRDRTQVYLRRNGISPRNWIHTAADVVRTLDWIGRKSEEATRLGIADKSRARGDSVTRSAFLQGQGTVDFRVRGYSKVSEVAYRTIKFFHAMTSALDRAIFRLGRPGDPNQPGNRKEIFKKMGLLAVGAGVLAVYNSREHKKEVDELQDYELDGAYHWWLFDEHMQMAKAYDYGILPMLAERTFVALSNGVLDGHWEAPGLGRAVVRAFATTFGIGLPVLGDEIAEQFLNKDLWTGASIVPEHLLRAEPFAQEKPGTPEILKRTARGLYGATGGRVQFSPARVHHIMDTILGHFGQLGLAIADYVAFGSGAAPAWQDYSFSIVKPPGGTNRATSEYYTMMDELGSLQETISSLRRSAEDQIGDTSTLDKLLDQQEDTPQAGLIRASRSWQESVADFNRDIGEARKDPKLSLSERRAKVTRLEKDRNIFMRESVAIYEEEVGHKPR